MNIVVMLSGFTGLLESWGFSGISAVNGNEVGRLYHFLIPLFLNLSLSIILAKEKGLDQIGTLLITMVCFFRASGFLSISETGELLSRHGSILISLPCTWFSVSLLHYLHQLRQFRLITHQTDISPRLKKTLNLIIPGLLTALSFELIGQGVTLILGATWPSEISSLFPYLQEIQALPELILYKIISLFTWFIGLHGEHSADGVFRILKVVPSGENGVIQLKTFHNVFMNIGGSGSTFVVPFLILFNRKINHFKSIARLSLPFAFFNVNEILLFGLPILLNPIFFIPFLLAPFVNMMIALTAIHAGLFTIDPSEIHWMSVPLRSAYIASHGSPLAVVTQLVCLVTDGLIYYPFLVLASQQQNAPLHLHRLFGQDAYGFVSEEINHRQERIFMNQQKAVMENVTVTQQVLRQLQGGHFTLFYQPKVNATSLKVIGLEALLRYKNAQGKILPPTFLPVLYEQGLSQVVDTKVVNLAFEQVIKWRNEGLIVPPVAINFDKDFLLDNSAVRDFITRAQELDVSFYIEITEHTYTVEVDALASVVKRLREAGHRISIDDFGAGYSSLTTLLALEADEIKLDRQLVIAHEEEPERGTVLLATSIQLCHSLGFGVVAEGVENEEQLQTVRRCGADVIQGYYLGKPMPAYEVCSLFQKVDADALGLHDYAAGEEQLSA